MVHETIKNFLASLPEDMFMRIHKSYVINLRRIDDESIGLALDEATATRLLERIADLKCAFWEGALEEDVELNVLIRMLERL